MEYSTGRSEQEVSTDGIEYERGSVFERLGKLTDLRKSNGKRYSLEMLLVIILMAKLCGANTPMEIAEWAEHRKEELKEEAVALEVVPHASSQHISEDTCGKDVC